MWRTRRPVGRYVAAVAVALVVVAGGSEAWAGEYHLYSCRMPDGEVAPTDGWSGSASGAAAYLNDGCGEGTALIAALEDGATHNATADVATWELSVLPEEKITGATLWRAGDADGGIATNATYEFWLAGPSDVDVFDECVYEFGCQLGMGDQADPLTNSNRVVVAENNLENHLYLNASCGGIPAYTCPSGKGDSNGYAAAIYLYAADLTLEQSSQPTVDKVEGELATASALDGTMDLSFHAEDAGSGVYQAIVSVDGTVVGRTTLDEDGGRCRDVGQTTDGLPAFLYLQPCPSSLNADIPLDTTSLADGAHHLVVSVSNAAGDSTVALDRRVTVANHPASPPSSPPPSEPLHEEKGGDGLDGGTAGGGASSFGPSPSISSSVTVAVANGTGASAGAVLRVRWAATGKASLASTYGHSQTVVGRLTASSGSPIGAAQIQVLSTPRFLGGKTVVLARPRTAADGSFRVRLPRSTPSTRLTFAYSAQLGQPAPDVTAALQLTVPAHLTLQVSPRVSREGGRIAFSGVLAGAPLPAGGKQIVLEARAPGGPWRQFQVLSTAAHGRYRARYRFRLPGPIVYRFRAVSRQEADFPYATGSSNVVTVREQ
jgi:hypothetical protein